MHNKLKIIKEILKLPKVKIEIIDRDSTLEIKNLYKYFTKRHPKYKIFKNKTIGVMLFEIPRTVEEYESQVSGKNSVKYYSNRCRKLGYHTDYFIKNEHLDEMYEINTSAPVRQGRNMSKSYLEKVPKEEPCDAVSYFGVFTEENKLVGYIRLNCTPNLYVVSRILGHSEYLKDNIMYLAMHDLVVSLIEKNNKIKDTTPTYLMYDTYFGAKDGLKLYKKRNAFKPYKVRWIYKDEKSNLQ